MCGAVSSADSLNKIASSPQFNAPRTSASMQSPIMMLDSFLALADCKANSKISGLGFLTPAISELVIVSK